MGQIADECCLDVEKGEQARALHRVVRAMHDGHCPKCGYLAPSEYFQVLPHGDHHCPRCDFTVSKEESTRALALFRPFLNKSVEVFEKWREDLKNGFDDLA